MQTVAVARNAMATRFEIVLHGEDAVTLRAAGEEALEEIQRVEAQLSLYQPTSEIARINARATSEAVRVTPSLFHLLQQARDLHAETKGAFDISIAPLVRCWGFMGGTGRLPDPEELAAAKARVGMQFVELDPGESTVRLTREGMMLDLGAIGKGYAVEQAANLLKELGVTSALINGGTSSIHALGHPPDVENWQVALEYPPTPNSASPNILATIPLRNEALSVSAVWGKSFQAQNSTFGHVLDPRLGRPVQGTLLAAVVLPSATETDALSTALLIAGELGHEQIASGRPAMRTVLLLGSGPNQELKPTGRGTTIKPFVTV
jgi:thiamine biosynthesis lipoprotein